MDKARHDRIYTVLFHDTKSEPYKLTRVALSQDTGYLGWGWTGRGSGASEAPVNDLALELSGARSGVFVLSIHRTVRVYRSVTLQ